MAVDYNPYKDKEQYLQDGGETGVYHNPDMMPDKVMTHPVDNEPDATKPSVRGMMDNVFGNSYLMSPEEEQRRINRARRAAMIGNLANAMAGFANLYYVNKGATPVTQPKAIIPDEMTFQDRVNAARKEAQLYRDARADKERSFRMQDEQMRLRQQAEERQERRLELDRWKADVMNDYRMGLLDVKKAQLELDRMYKEGRLSNDQYKAESGRISAMASQQRADTASQKANQGTTTTTTDSFGNKKVVVKKPNGGGNNKGNSGNNQKTKIVW